MSRSSRRRSLLWRKKLVFAAMTTCLFFVVLELGLAALGVKPLTQTGDPFVGFSNQVPLFIPDRNGPETTSEAQIEQGSVRMRTAPGKFIWFNPQIFDQQKRPGTRRVFCMGGSTTYGRPFDDSTSFCRYLREFLPLVDGDHQWEVINAGGISYASYRVAALMEELAQYEPDLFVVLSAHNEFLERRTYDSMFNQDASAAEVNALLYQTRTWTLVSKTLGRSAMAEVDAREILPEEVDEILNHSAGPKDYHRDDVWADHVTRHYEFNLTRMIQIARDAGAEIVFLSPASNLRDCSPFKSESSEQFNDAQMDEVHSICELIESELRDGQFQQALMLCEQVAALDPRNAQLQYLYGKSLFGLQRYELAEAAFRKAIDEDVCPLRATSKIIETIHRVASDQAVTLIDFERRLRELSIREHGHACFGSEYFLDHVHPTIDVHRQVALWVIDGLLNAGWLTGHVPDDSQVLAIKDRVESQIDTRSQGVAFRNLAKVLHWAGKFDEAAPRARDAIRLLPGDLESRFVLADCLQQTGRQEEAFRTYEELFEIADYPRAYLPFGELLAERGDLQQAKSFLIRAIAGDDEDYRTRAHYALGMVHYQLGEFDFALESLRESDRRFPNDSATIALIGESELARGQWESAVNEFHRLLDSDPSNFYAHFRLAEILLEHNRLAEARQQIDLAVQLEPSDPQAQSKQKEIADRLESDAP